VSIYETNGRNTSREASCAGAGGGRMNNNGAQNARRLLEALGEGSFKIEHVLAAAQVWALIGLVEALEKQA
jgi:predicted flavoprotein YhiN